MKSKKWIYIFLLPLMLMISGCSDTETYNVSAESGLNVRATPSSKGKVVGKLNHLDDVEVISLEDNWAKIKYNDTEAYVSAKHLSKGSGWSGVWFMIIVFLFAALGGGTVVHLKKDGTPDMRFKSNRR